MWMVGVRRAYVVTAARRTGAERSMVEKRRIKEHAVKYDEAEVSVRPNETQATPHRRKAARKARAAAVSAHKAKVDALLTKILHRYAGAWKRLADL